MEIPVKKLRNGFEIPVFGLGTYMMGEGNDAKDIAAIKAALEMGITHIDTAESYADGNCEEIVGRAIQGYDRSKLFLVSKVQQNSLSYPRIKRALQATLDRLQTPYLDLYLMHRCPQPGQFEECVMAMSELLDEGTVKHIGLSNTNTQHTRELQRLSKHPLVVNQVHYNLQFREPEQDGLLDYCQQHDTLLMAWRPVNKGALNKSGTDLTKTGIEILDTLCQKYQKTPAQVAINWLLNQPNVITLAKSSSLDHLRENLGAIGWQMETDDIERLRQEFPNRQNVSDTVPLA